MVIPMLITAVIFMMFIMVVVAALRSSMAAPKTIAGYDQHDADYQ